MYSFNFQCWTKANVVSYDKLQQLKSNIEIKFKNKYNKIATQISVEYYNEDIRDSLSH